MIEYSSIYCGIVGGTLVTYKDTFQQAQFIINEFYVFFNTTSPHMSIPTTSSPFNLNSHALTALNGSSFGCVPLIMAVTGSPSSLVKKRRNVLGSGWFLCLFR